MVYIAKTTVYNTSINKENAMSQPHTIYSDTALGASCALRSVADKPTYERVKALLKDGHMWAPDPMNAGVWGIVKMNGEHSPGRAREALVVVYMAGYEDACGRVRTLTDFEVQD